MDIRTASRTGRSGLSDGLQYSEHIRFKLVTTIHNSQPNVSKTCQQLHVKQLLLLHHNNNKSVNRTWIKITLSCQLNHLFDEYCESVTYYSALGSYCLLITWCNLTSFSNPFTSKLPLINNNCCNSNSNIRLATGVMIPYNADTQTCPTRQTNIYSTSLPQDHNTIN